MFQRLFGNASEADAVALQKELDALLVEGERVTRSFKLVRDMFVLTDSRLILIGKQGLTGRKTGDRHHWRAEVRLYAVRAARGRAPSASLQNSATRLRRRVLVVS